MCKCRSFSAYLFKEFGNDRSKVRISALQMIYHEFTELSTICFVDFSWTLFPYMSGGCVCQGTATLSSLAAAPASIPFSHVGGSLISIASSAFILSLVGILIMVILTRMR